MSRKVATLVYYIICLFVIYPGLLPRYHHTHTPAPVRARPTGWMRSPYLRLPSRTMRGVVRAEVLLHYVVPVDAQLHVVQG